MAYKGYRVVEQIIRDARYPETALVLQAPCGCKFCEDQIQPGHFACSTTPKKLRNDSNVFPRLEGDSWFWEFLGPDKHVDQWLNLD